jgi:hypothetical protein
MLSLWSALRGGRATGFGSTARSTLAWQRRSERFLCKLVLLIGWLLVATRWLGTWQWGFSCAE